MFKFYNHIHSHVTVPKVFHWLWKSSCVMSAKFFAWLVLHDRINTRDRLQRKHWRVTMIHIACCVLLELMKTECTYFLSAISVDEFGIICRSLGMVTRTFNLLFMLLDKALESLSSWRSSWQHAVIFGYGGMLKSLEMNLPLLGSGRGVLYMISLF
jgi:hypothetical protein